MIIKDRYNLTLKENIFLAKKTIVETIYNSAKLERLHVTFPDTYSIYYKIGVSSAIIEEIATVLNLKYAWQYVLANIDKSIDLNFICNVHREIAKDEAISWGELRTGGVGISGTDYKPPIPVGDEVINKLDVFNQMTSDTDRAVERMLWMFKQQLFWDGNKRTSMMVANKDLIEHGRGIISVEEKDIPDFNRLLSRFYSFDEKDNLKEFICEKAIHGITFEKDEARKELILE